MDDFMEAPMTVMRKHIPDIENCFRGVNNDDVNTCLLLVNISMVTSMQRRKIGIFENGINDDEGFPQSGKF